MSDLQLTNMKIAHDILGPLVNAPVPYSIWKVNLHLSPDQLRQSMVGIRRLCNLNPAAAWNLAIMNEELYKDNARNGQMVSWGIPGEGSAGAA